MSKVITPQFNGTKVLYRILDAIKRGKKTLVLPGSTRSSKTYSILQWIILRCVTVKTSVTISRFTFTAMNNTVIKDFKEIMSDLGLYSDKCYNHTTHEYTFKHNNSIISFVSGQDYERFRGQKQDILWFDEAIEIPEETYQQAETRTSILKFLSYNPSAESHWIYDKVIPLESTEYIHSTYLDNKENLSDEQVRSIERYEPTPENIKAGTADEVFWKIYGLGLPTGIQGKIFTNYEVIPLSHFPRDKERVGYGMDFGFSNDPSTLVYKFEYNGAIYLHELLYEAGLTAIINKDNPTQLSIQRRLQENKVNFTDIIVADSARPEIIVDLQGCGYNITKCDKGKSNSGIGSIEYGIELLKRYKIYISEESPNLKREFEHYRLVGGKYKGDDHLIDAVRYIARKTCARVPYKEELLLNKIRTVKQKSDITRYF